MSILAIYIPKTRKQYLWDLACQRSRAKPTGASTHVDKRWSDKEIDFLGLLGEEAATTYTGTKLDESVHSSGDGGVDLVLPSTTTAGVKYRHTFNPQLIVSPNRRDTPEELWDFRSDVAILTGGYCSRDACFCKEMLDLEHDSHVLVWGWTTKQQFMLQKIDPNWRNGPRWIMPAHKLYPPLTLLALDMLG